MSEAWSDDDSQMAQEDEEREWTEKLINESEFFDDAFESWNSLGVDEDEDEP